MTSKTVSNARINPPEASARPTRYRKPRNLMMKNSLARVGLNELLGKARPGENRRQKSLPLDE